MGILMVVSVGLFGSLQAFTATTSTVGNNNTMMMMGASKEQVSAKVYDPLHLCIARGKLETRVVSKMYDGLQFNQTHEIPRDVSFSLLEPNPINPKRMKVVSRVDLRELDLTFGGGGEGIDPTPFPPFPPCLPMFSDRMFDEAIATRMPATSQTTVQKCYDQFKEQKEVCCLSTNVSNESHLTVRSAVSAVNTIDRGDSSHEVDSLGFSDYLNKKRTSSTSGSLVSCYRDTSPVEDVHAGDSLAQSIEDNDAGGRGDLDHSNRWGDKFSELKAFIRAHGHARVPVRYNSNLPLSKWAKRQRYQWKLKQEGKHSTLTHSREAKLVEVGFLWDIRLTIWEERYAELLEFRNRYGHCNVPIACADYPKLGTWVKCQRRQWKLRCGGQKSSMTPSRIVKLEAVGFSWEAR